MLVSTLFTIANMALLAAASDRLASRAAATDRAKQICSTAPAGSELAAQCSTASFPAKRSTRLESRDCKYQQEESEICLGPREGGCRTIVTKSRCDVCYDSETLCIACVEGSDPTGDPVGTLGLCLGCMAKCDTPCC